MCINYVEVIILAEWNKQACVYVYAYIQMFFKFKYHSCFTCKNYIS